MFDYAEKNNLMIGMLDGNPIARAILRQQTKVAASVAAKATRATKGGGTTPDDVIVKKKTRFGLDANSNVDDGTTNETEFDAFDDDDDGFATKTTEARQKETPLKSAVSFTRRKRKGGCFIQPTEAVKVGDEKKADEEEEKRCKVRCTPRASDDEPFSKKKTENDET